MIDEPDPDNTGGGKSFREHKIFVSFSGIKAFAGISCEGFFFKEKL